MLRSTDAGLSWLPVELDEAARRVAAGDAPLLASVGSVIAIADAARGTVVSADSGTTFRRVPGCVNATCLAAGALDGCPTVWAALYHEGSDLTDLCMLDPYAAVARRIAQVRADAARSDPLEESLELARIAALRWDPDMGRLWGVGGFGLRSWSPGRKKP